MGVSLDTARPALSPTALVRRRADGSAALYDPATGVALEIAPDQASLLALLDGNRSVGELMEAHYAQHRSMPLGALDDLLGRLAAAGALVGGSTRVRPAAWLARLATPRALFRVRVPLLGALSVLLSLGAVASVVKASPPPPLIAWDVPLAWAGAALAHSLRRWLQAAFLPLLGGGATHLELGVTAGVLHVGPDVGGLVLLERPRRVLGALLGLTGLFVAFVVAAAWSRGLAFGAGLVAVAELCPFAPTLFGRLLATLAGKVDLQEHARAYVDRRLLRRAVSASTFDGETSLVWTSVLSLGWLGLVVRLLFTSGAVIVLRLLALSVEASGLEKALALTGAGVVAVSLPASLVALGLVVARALLALRPPRPTDAGTAAAPGAAKTELGAIPLFARLPPDERAALAAAGEERRYAKGATLVTQGEPGDRFFAVLSGAVTVHVEADSGLSREVARLSAGDCFGEAALLGEGRRTATVRAAEEVAVLALGRDGFARVQGALGARQLEGVLRSSAALKKSGFFGALPADRLSALAFRLVPRPVAAGEVLIEFGRAGDACYLVAEGRFEVLGTDGAVVATLGPGDHFGEVALLRDVPRTATVRAKEPGVVLALGREDFLSAVVGDLGLSRRLEALAAMRAEAAR